MLAYNPTTNRAQWIPVWGSASDLLLVEEASPWELSNIVLHVRVAWRRLQLKCFSKRNSWRKPCIWGTNLAPTGERTVTAWMVHIPLGMVHTTPLQDAATEAASAEQTSAHPKARISMSQRMLWTPPMKPLKRVRGGAVNSAILPAR